MARKRGWLGRVPLRLLGDRMAYALDMYYDLEEGIDSSDALAQRYIPIAAGTCLELFYRQVGQRMFDPRTRMYTAVSLSIAPADLAELGRTIPLLGPADLFWLDRRIQGVDDIKSVLDELDLSSPFKGNPALLEGTHLLFSIRNDRVHGMGTRRHDRRQTLQTVRDHVEKILRQMPPLFAVFLLLGGIRADLRGDGKAAAALYSRAASEADKSDADVSVRHVIAGKAAEGLGRRDEAMGRYKKAISADPGNANAHAAMGCLFARERRDEDALAEYDKAVKIEPAYANAHMGRGSVLLRLGRPADALASYRRAAEADPSHAEAHVAAGRIHESQGRPADALASYRRAAEADPSHAGAHAAAGRIHESQGRPADALASYRRAAEADPSHAEAHAAAGRIHESQGRPADALASYRRAAEADPSHAEAHVAAGRIHESQGRPADALASYRRAAEADPSHAGAHAAAGRINESQGRPADALASYRRAAEADPSHAEAHAAAGMLNEVINNLPESMSGYDAAAGLADAKTPVKGARARILERQGRVDDMDDILLS